MAAGGQALESQTHLASRGFADPHGRLPIDLDGHMRPESEIAGIAQRPVFDLQHQVNLVSPGHRAVIRAAKTQLRSMLIQLPAQLLDSSRRGHFLQPRAGGPTQPRWLAVAATRVEPAPPSLHLNRHGHQQQHGQQHPQQRLQDRLRHGGNDDSPILDSLMASSPVFVNQVL